MFEVRWNTVWCQTLSQARSLSLSEETYKMFDNRSNLLNKLYITSSSTDDTNLLVTQLNALLRPNSGVMTFPFESLQALEWRDIMFGGKAGA